MHTHRNVRFTLKGGSPQSLNVRSQVAHRDKAAEDILHTLALTFRVQPEGVTLLDPLLTAQQKPTEPEPEPPPFTWESIGVPLAIATHLRTANLLSIAEVDAKSDSALIRLPGLGPASVRDLRKAIADHKAQQ